VKIGQRVLLAMTIDHDEKDGPLTGVYLFVNGSSWGMSAAGPTGAVVVIAHKSEPLGRDEKITAAWTAAPLNGSRHLHISTMFQLSSSGTGGTATDLNLID
jgi:hypothetical protein